MIGAHVTAIKLQVALLLPFVDDPFVFGRRVSFVQNQQLFQNEPTILEAENLGNRNNGASRKFKSAALKYIEIRLTALEELRTPIPITTVLSTSCVLIDSGAKVIGFADKNAPFTNEWSARNLSLPFV